MPRKPYARTLPDLSELLPDFTGFASSENHTARTVETVRLIVGKARRPQAAPFYSMREIADFLHVPYRTVSLAYERLGAEGLLTRVRSSHTILEGAKRQPRNAVRGVIGIPVYLPPLVIGTDWRAFLMHIEDELRRYHFVTDFVIYRAGEQESNALTERLIEHDLDMVLWYAPVKANIPTMEYLIDGGVELVVVSDGKARFPREQYYLDLECAIEQGLQDWRDSGIRSATILQSPRHPSAYARSIVERLLKEGRWDYDLVTIPDDELPVRVKALARQRDNGVLLTSHTWYNYICGRYPDTMENLFIFCRVFLLQGPVYNPYLLGKEVFADSIILPNEQMSKRIGGDINNNRSIENRRQMTFHTQYQSRMNLGSISQQL